MVTIRRLLISITLHWEFMNGWMNEWMNHLVSFPTSPMKAFEFPTLGGCKSHYAPRYKLHLQGVQWQSNLRSNIPFCNENCSLMIHRELNLSRTADRLNNHHQRLKNSLKVRLRKFKILLFTSFTNFFLNFFYTYLLLLN